MKAKELYHALEAELGAWLTSHGFKKRRGSRLTFQRKIGDRYHSVWFQPDKWGWDPHSGSSFYVNFTVSESPKTDEGARRDERLNFFLTDAELVHAREYRDAVVARSPRPPESYFATLETQFKKTAQTWASLVATVRAQFDPEPLPYRRNQDFALRYWEHRDVVGWAVFIVSVLPRAIEQMESWELPQPSYLAPSHEEL